VEKWCISTGRNDPVGERLLVNLRCKAKPMEFKEIIGNVERFHNAFKIENNYEPKADLSSSEIELRHRLMKEENEEYLEAAKNNDLVEIADALGDQLYILCGTILKHGLQDKIEEVFSEIQRSNMSKLDKNGNPIYRDDGKVLKSDMYFKPDISSILISEKESV